MKHCCLLIVCLNLCLCQEAWAQDLIPPSRKVDWSQAGYPGLIPHPNLIVDVTDHGAAGDGITDDHAAIMDAVAALNGRQGVVYLPAGNYAISSTLILPDSAILKGDGADQTRIQFDFNQLDINGINIKGTPPDSFTAILSGATKGSDEITVADGSLFSVGDYTEIRQDNGTWDVKPASWADHSIGMIVQIKAVNGNTLTLAHPLRMDLDLARNPEIGTFVPAREVGLECLAIERTDSPATGTAYNTYFKYAVNCWMTGVESDKSLGAHVLMEAAAHIEVKGSYFHEAFIYDGTGTRGYGVTMLHHTSDCRVEDNIFRMLRHAMMVKQGANGNVWAYNYSREPNRVEIPYDGSGDISLHGHFAFANLFEGNIVQSIIIDHFWGPSGPYNTFFRNRTELYGLVMSNFGFSPEITNQQNFVGNEITSKGALPGSYTLLGTDHFQHGNNDKGTIVPTGTAVLDDSTYYCNGHPLYWLPNDAWPSLGPPLALDEGTNPAYERYIDGTNLLSCTYPDPDTASTMGLFQAPHQMGFSLYPNPFSNYVFVSSDQPMPTNLTVKVWNMDGQMVLQQVFQATASTYALSLPPDLPPGIYCFELNTGKEAWHRKAVKWSDHY